VGFDFAARIFETNPIVIGPREIQVHNLDWIHEAALEFLDTHHDRPFFLYYAVTVPHRPYNGWKHNPRATPIGILPARPGHLPTRESIAKRLAEHGLDEDRGDLLWLDDCVGSLLEELKTLGVLDNTVIVYTNDHGDDGGKTTCYQGGMANFAFVWGPKRLIAGGRTIDSPSSLVDLAPTIFDLCGGTPVAGRYDGVSLKPLLAGRKESVRDVIYGEMGHTRTVIKGKWKYLALRYSDYHQRLPRAERLAWLDAANEYQRSNRWTTFEANDPDGPFGHSGFIPDLWDHEKVARASYENFYDANQLYDLDRDPREQKNLAGDPRYAPILNEMKQELKKQLADLPGGYAEFKPAGQPLLPMADRIRIGRELMKDVFH
jgi:arylsulfatase A-like enzyme